MDIRLEVDTAAQITRAFAGAPGIVLDELETAMLSSMQYLRRETMERTPEDLSTLRNAFITDVTRSELLDGVFGRLTNAMSYALPVELGTKPHYPPIAPLEAWVERHLHYWPGADYDNIPGIALGVQRLIGRYGTEPKRMAHRALRAGVSTVHAEFTAAAERITARIAAAGDGGAGAPA